MKNPERNKPGKSERVSDPTLRSSGSEGPPPRGRGHAEKGPSATTAPGPESDEVVPPRLDISAATRFEDHGEIARGGMGSIRRVYDTLLRREVAMKIGDPSNPTYSQAALRFMEEAQITGQLDHPNIVPVHDLGAGADSKGVFFTMKLVEGETLSAFIERLHRSQYDHRAIERFLEIFGKVCDALSFAHSRGVVHRDLKPDNVMVGSHGQVYVMDWGVALIARGERPAESAVSHVSLSDDLSRDTREEAGAIVGTFEYMAPEQAWGRTDEIDARTDVFGLGGILYHMLTGKGPSSAPTSFEALQRAQRGRPNPPEQQGAWASLPPGLCLIATRALARDRADRYASVLDLKAEISDFLRGGGWFQTRIYSPGELIVEQGANADAAYIIVAGECEVFRGSGADRVALRRLTAGDVFGETAVLTGGPRSASVVAIDTVTVKIVTSEALERELGRQSWAGAFVRALAERFRDADQELANLRDSTR